MIVLMIVSFGCKSIDNNILNPKDELDKKLPAMKLNFDKSNLENIFDAAYINKVYTKMYRIEMNNIFDESGKKYGEVNMRINLVDESMPGIPLLIMSIATLGTFNLLGFPSNYTETTIEMEFIIKNSEEEVIKKYKITGEGNSYIALYWGYESGTSTKLAFSNCLKQIKAKLIKNFDEINANLIKSGPSKKKYILED
jgi:hypothetical protein